VGGGGWLLGVAPLVVALVRAVSAGVPRVVAARAVLALMLWGSGSWPSGVSLSTMPGSLAAMV
jgi:hypothetical protein